MCRRWLQILMALLTLPALPGAAATVSLVPGSIGAMVGDTYAVDVRVAEAADLYAFQFDLVFDPAVVQVDDVIEGDFLRAGGRATSFIPGSIDNGTGLVSFTANSLLGPGPGVSGDGVLVRLWLSAGAAGHSDLSLDNVLLLDAALGELDVSTVNATIDVAAPGHVPEAPTLALAALALLIGWRGTGRRAPHTGA